MKKFNKYILLVVVVVIGAATYGFVHTYGNTSIKGNNTTAIKAKEQSLQKKKSNYAPPPPSSEIIGTWLDENEPGHKLEFTASGEIKIYSENVLISTSTYEISNTCDGETYGGLYIKIYDEYDGSELCYYVYGINANNSGVLSILAMGSGHIEVYNKL